MSTSLFKNHKQTNIQIIINYIFLFIFILILIFFSWLFLFIYNHVYFALVEEMAIINLKSQFVIMKVHKTQFNNLVKNYETKQKPLIEVNFKNLKNPFKSEVISNW